MNGRAHRRGKKGPKRSIFVRMQAMLLSIMMLITMIPINISAATESNKDQTGNADIKRELILQYKNKSEDELKELKDPYKIDDASKVEMFFAEYSFALEDNENENGEAQRTVHAGDYYIIDLPKEIQITNPNHSGSIVDGDGETIANYSFTQDEDKSWKVKVVFSDYVDNKDRFDIYGELKFDFTLDLSKEPAGQSKIIEIPIDSDKFISLEVKKPVPPSTTPVQLEKRSGGYSNETGQLNWSVEIKPANAVLEGATFKDKIDTELLELSSVKHKDLVLEEGKDYTYNHETGELTYLIPAGRDGWTNITIATRVRTDKVFNKQTKTTIANKAYLTGGDYDIDLESNTATKEITPNWIKKNGALVDGNRIKWTLDINTSNQKFYDGVITDTFQPDTYLDKNSLKMGDQLISIYDDAHSPADDSEIYGVYQENSGQGSVLKIYLPRGTDNLIKTKQTFTYITDVEKIASPTPNGFTKYQNAASLEGKFLNGNGQPAELPKLETDLIGVGVPDVNLEKSGTIENENDKKMGIITWKIKAASNHTPYGKTKLVDTLPDDQSFIKDEIYWGDQKLTETSKPQAVISADGRTLTILFNDTENVLNTQQEFTIKTQIKNEIYGDNFGKNFENNIKAILLEKNTDSEIVTKETPGFAYVSNTVISKKVEDYQGNTTKAGQNPRVNFSITINQNKMPLKNVVIEDDLDAIKTQWKDPKDNSVLDLEDVKWNYVKDSLKIVKSSGNSDNLNLEDIADKVSYEDNKLRIDFGEGVAVNDQYTLKFTAELDVNKYPIFKHNGTISCKGNVASIEADGLSKGTISTKPLGDSKGIRNEVLGKIGKAVDGQQIKWNIKINQHRIGLDNTNVVDEFQEGLTLDPTSIKLYKNVIKADNSFIDMDNVESLATPVEFEYTYKLSEEGDTKGKYVLTVKLPDNQTDYILSFATDVDHSLFGKDISNSAYFSGESKEEEEFNTFYMQLWSFAGGGSVKKASATAQKLDSETGEGLPGAVFELNWLKDGTEPVFVRNMTTSENGTVTFRGLSRGEQYTIKEIKAPEGYGIDDPSIHTIEIPESTGGPDINLVFTDSKIKVGSWVPQALKQLDGKDLMHSFEFELLDSDGSTVLMNGSTAQDATGKTAPVTFNMSEGVSSENILKFSNHHQFTDNENESYPVVKNKTFYIREVIKDMPGYEFDSAIYSVNVNVYNVKGQNDLKVEAEVKDKNGNKVANALPVFINHYNADGSLLISAEKNLKGHKLNKGMFSFEIREGDRVVSTGSNEEGSLEADTWKAQISFSPIPYTLADVGTKTYTMVEKNNNNPGYTYDESKYEVEVAIEDLDNGKLSSTIKSIKKIQGNVETDASQTGVVFDNEYKTSDLTIDLEAEKNLTGRPIEDGQFSYLLQQVDENQKLIQKLGEVKNVGNKISLPPITYKQNDIGKTYYYQLSEVNDHQKGYVYDDSVYVISEQILDAEDGTLKRIETITKNGKVQDKIVFTNQYQAKGSLEIKASKQLDGRKLADGQFTFGLQQFDETLKTNIGKEITATNGVNGDIIFPELLYTQEDIGKTYSYELYEKKENASGYTYDDTVYIVHVEIRDNGDGTLTVENSITDKGKEVPAVTFKNVYTTTDIEVPVNARKVLNGRKLADNQFKFTLNEVDDEGSFIKKLQQVTNDEEGLISFSPLHYTQKDIGKTFYYQIVEENTGEKDYTYDLSVYKMSIFIEDNADGTLSAKTSITLDKAGKTSIEFMNTYVEPDIIVNDTGDVKTGDKNSAGIYWMIIASSFLAFSIALRRSRKSSSENEEK